MRGTDVLSMPEAPNKCTRHEFWKLPGPQSRPSVQSLAWLDPSRPRPTTDEMSYQAQKNWQQIFVLVQQARAKKLVTDHNPWSRTHRAAALTHCEPGIAHMTSHEKRKVLSSPASRLDEAHLSQCQTDVGTQSAPDSNPGSSAGDGVRPHCRPHGCALHRGISERLRWKVDARREYRRVG